jgi:hypothetical protein
MRGTKFHPDTKLWATLYSFAYINLQAGETKYSELHRSKPFVNKFVFAVLSKYLNTIYIASTDLHISRWIRKALDQFLFHSIFSFRNVLTDHVAVCLELILTYIRTSYYTYFQLPDKFTKCRWWMLSIFCGISGTHDVSGAGFTHFLEWL